MGNAAGNVCQYVKADMKVLGVKFYKVNWREKIYKNIKGKVTQLVFGGSEPDRQPQIRLLLMLHFLIGLSSVFGKKVGEFIKMESESTMVIGLKIPRDYYLL